MFKIKNNMVKNFIEELTWRNMIHDVMPGAEEHLLEAMRSAYIGFDPTADSLHIGNLVPIMLLAHYQRCGHKPYALVGGATGMIGDPSGKSNERNLLDETTLRHNQEAIKKQLEEKMTEKLIVQGDPRVLGKGDIFDYYPHGKGDMLQSLYGDKYYDMHQKFVDKYGNEVKTIPLPENYKKKRP